MKILSKSEKHNENYLCHIIKVENCRKHSNADRLQVTSIFGNNIITGMDTKVGDIKLYFPIGIQINSEYLHHNNEFNESQLNKDTTLKGYFREKGQVRCEKLRGEPSMGYIVPVESLSFMLSDKEIEEIKNNIGETFDTINENFLLVKKFEPKPIKEQGSSGSGKVKEPKLKELLVPNQFRLHVNTPHLGDNINRINPDDEIVILKKLHGSSNIDSNVLIKRKLNFLERILKKYLKINIPETEYGYVYSSGKPKSSLPKGIQGSYVNPNDGFYRDNIWEANFKQVKGKLVKGISLFSELVGFTPSGAYIQNQYDYGCDPNTFKSYVYRMTTTNVDGNVIELNWYQIKAYCKMYGLETVPELYIGKAKDLFGELAVTETWNKDFLDKLKEKYLEKDCSMSKNKIPDEGIVLQKVDNFNGYQAFKLKSFKFCERESKALEKGIPQDSEGDNE